MKKKIEKLRRDGRLEDNAAFETLWTNFKTTETALEKARTDRKLAKSTFQFERDAAVAKEEEGQHIDRVFELEMAWRKADGERLISRADYQLAKFRLRRWVEAFSRLTKAPEPSQAVLSKKKASRSNPKKESRKSPEAQAAPKASAAPGARRKPKTEQ